MKDSIREGERGMGMRVGGRGRDGQRERRMN